MPPELELGQLEQVPLRDAWPREASEFTPWLARAENLTLLGAALGLGMELEGVEQTVGPFRADILCREIGDDRLVLIENQLERTDHTHLGQLITYTAGLDTAMIIWIAAQFTPEHRAALNWLNTATTDEFRFFGIEVELWRIGDSKRAPRFKVISQPNSWTKSVARAARAVQSGELTELGQIRQAYWSGFRRYLEANGRSLKLTKDYAGTHVNFPVEGSDFTVVAYRAVSGPGVFVRVKEPHIAGYDAALQRYREEINAAIGRRLLPDEESRGTSWLRDSLSADPCDERDWPRQFQWLADTVGRFRGALRIIVERLQESANDAAA